MRWLQILRISVFIVLICAASTSGSAQESPNWRYAPTIFTWAASSDDLKSSLSAPEDRPLVTDRPTFTPATSTVGLGRIQLETGYTFFSDESSGSRVRQHSFPESLLRVRIVADWLELRVTQNFMSQQSVGGGNHSTTTGAQDLLVGVKLALSKNESWLPEAAIIARLRVPSGSNVYTGNRVLPGLQYAYSWQTVGSRKHSTAMDSG